MTDRESFYSAAYDLPAPVSVPLRSIMLAVTPRSGSTYVGLELWRTGQFGVPLEYLNPVRRIDMLSRVANGDCSAYWQEVKKRRTSANGIFSCKAFAPDLVQVEQNYPGLSRDIHNDFIIYLSRRDKVDQAISFAKAEQTGKWHSTTKHGKPAAYDLNFIDAMLARIHAHEQAWESIFSALKVEPLRIDYEDFVSDGIGAMTKIFSHCEIGLDPDCQIDLPRLTVQRDEESAHWRSRYMSDKQSAPSPA